MSKTIKLTPKGKRFGDVIREILKDPDSLITKSVANLKVWKYLCQSRPKEFRLELEDGPFPRIVGCKGKGRNVIRTSIGLTDSVSIYFQAYAEYDKNGNEI